MVSIEAAPQRSIDVSVIIPCRNVSPFIVECLESVLNQTFADDTLTVEISLFDDCSDDDTVQIVKSYEQRFYQRRFEFVFDGQRSGKAKGVGFAKNAAVRQSHGRFLCFLDADDVASLSRIQLQFEAASKFGNSAFIGAKFTRDPADSTRRYTKWANTLTADQLKIQVYTSNGPTLVAPTWFVARRLYDLVGGFDEKHAVGYPEDLNFFFKCLNVNAQLYRVDEYLVMYRYHATCASFSVDERTIFDLRVEEFERKVLPHWSTLTIWNAGKQGRAFFKRLAEDSRRKVRAFCDVDPKKIELGFYESYERINGKAMVGRRVPIISYEDARPPVVVCVKMDLTAGVLENNVAKKNWIEGIDYYFLC